MRINKWSLSPGAGGVLLFLAVCVLASCPKSAFAAASISLTGTTPWALGTKGASSESTSTANAWIATNDSGGTEDVNIKVSSTGIWTASANGTQVANQFVLRKDSSTGAIITATDSALVTGLVNAATSSFGLYFKAPPTGSEEGAHTLTVTLTATNWAWPCGSGLTVTHTSGTVAPVTKTVTYGTVTSTLSGLSKCWITQNLGADNQAASATDATEPPAGWYWQFNRIQGFKHDGTTRTPATAWDATNDNTYTGWDPAKDPCTLLLGTGWRIPTNTEWTNVISNGSWTTPANTYASVLKLHAAGYLNYSDGSLGTRGTYEYYWSSTQLNSLNGYYLDFTSGVPGMYSTTKAYGFSLRCLKD